MMPFCLSEINTGSVIVDVFPPRSASVGLYERKR